MLPEIFPRSVLIPLQPLMGPRNFRGDCRSFNRRRLSGSAWEIQVSRDYDVRPERERVAHQELRVPYHHPAGSWRHARKEAHIATHVQQAAKGRAKGHRQRNVLLEGAASLGQPTKNEETRAQAKCAVSGSAGPRAFTWEDSIDGCRGWRRS